MNKAQIEAVRWAALTAKTRRMWGTASLLEGLLPAGTAPLCSTCGGHGTRQDGNSGTEADGYAPNIVECECSPEERHPESRPRTVTPAPMPGAVGYTVILRNGVQWPLSAPPAAEPARPRVVPFEQRHCQSGWEACLAGRRDGVVCPQDSCDIDDGIRKA